MRSNIINLPLHSDCQHLIFGDIHGKYDEMLQVLDLANYDSTSDIVYCVGDMIDRGKDSAQVLEFFTQKNCYAIMGNHELMMIDNSCYGAWVIHGGLCTTDSLREQNKTVEWAEDIIKTLPLAIDVGEPDEEHSFRIIHAEMPAGWSDADMQQKLDDANDYNDDNVYKLLWSRELIKTYNRNEYLKKINPDHPTYIEFHPDRSRNIFCGHTPVEHVTEVGDHWFIDTFASRQLTAINAVTKEIFSIHHP